MKKNVGSQVVGAQMVATDTGAAYTSPVMVYVTGDNGTQTAAAAAASATHKGNGWHTYAPTQAETNYTHVAYTFATTGAVPQTVQIYTSFPQGGDAYLQGTLVATDLRATATAVLLATTFTPVGVWTYTIETGATAAESLRLANSANGGLTSGMESGSPVLRDLANSKDRVQATTDANGNRTAVTRDLT